MQPDWFIFTPVINSGVSIEGQHFDIEFEYATPHEGAQSVASEGNGPARPLAAMVRLPSVTSTSASRERPRSKPIPMLSTGSTGLMS